ncbi:MAG: hypothetical protein COA78_10850 [Blastopirellula sp.]|nr:MAG: hypothetical protein COA78_10850 [Blastopirellula sp.]
MRLTKAQKKELRRKAEDDAVNKVYRSFVVPVSMDPMGFAEILKKGLRGNGIDPSIVLTEGTTSSWIVSNPDDNDQFIRVSITSLSASDADEISEFDMIVEGQVNIAPCITVIEIKGQLAKSPVHDLLFTSIIKTLGPRTRGLLVQMDGMSVIDDWLAWSLDYMGPSVSDVIRVYDDDCPDFAAVLNDNPGLKYIRPWWKLWK